nr:MAG TPA: hypothetical protein [Bacteriophage sp.]
MTPDEQTLYFFAFRYALPRQTYALSLVSNLILERVNDFEDWQLRDMIGEIELSWEWNKDIHPIDRDVQRFFRDRLQDALLERSVKQAVSQMRTSSGKEVNRMPKGRYLYSFDEEGDHPQFYFSSVDEALEDARKNADGEESVYIWKQERLELCVSGEEVIEDMRCQIDEEGLDEDYLECPEQSALEELSDMLTNTFQAWADKHGYEKSIAYGTDAELYDLKTGRPVLE